MILDKVKALCVKLETLHQRHANNSACTYLLESICHGSEDLHSQVESKTLESINISNSMYP